MNRLARCALLIAAAAGGGKPVEPPASTTPPTAAAPGAGVVRAPESGSRTESAVLTGLRWLESRQSADGSWDGDVSTTALALLAFLGAGETHQSASCKEI